MNFFIFEVVSLERYKSCKDGVFNMVKGPTSPVLADELQDCLLKCKSQKYARA